MNLLNDEMNKKKEELKDGQWIAVYRVAVIDYFNNLLTIIKHYLSCNSRIVMTAIKIIKLTFK